MSNKRYSVIDEESDEKRPTELFSDAKTLLRERDQSKQSCDLTYADNSSQNMFGQDKPIKSSNTSYVKRPGIFNMNNTSSSKSHAISLGLRARYLEQQVGTQNRKGSQANRVAGKQNRALGRKSSS